MTGVEIQFHIPGQESSEEINVMETSKHTDYIPGCRGDQDTPNTQLPGHPSSLLSREISCFFRPELGFPGKGIMGEKPFRIHNVGLGYIFRMSLFPRMGCNSVAMDNIWSGNFLSLLEK